MAFSDRAVRDKNFVPSATFEVDGVPGTVMAGQIDQTTGRILVDVAGGLSTTNFKTETFTSTNGQTTFAASFTIDFDNGFYVNGSRQRPSTDYTISGQSYVLTNGIPSGNDVIISYITNNP